MARRVKAKRKAKPIEPDNDGLRCPACWSCVSEVIWTRQVADVRIRSRQCFHCGRVFRTTERLDKTSE